MKDSAPQFRNFHVNFYKFQELASNGNSVSGSGDCVYHWQSLGLDFIYHLEFLLTRKHIISETGSKFPSSGGRKKTPTLLVL
jgi:hypothetical protein